MNTRQRALSATDDSYRQYIPPISRNDDMLSVSYRRSPTIAVVVDVIVVVVVDDDRYDVEVDDVDVADEVVVAFVCNSRNAMMTMANC